MTNAAAGGGYSGGRAAIFKLGEKNILKDLSFVLKKGQIFLIFFLMFYNFLKFLLFF